MSTKTSVSLNPILGREVQLGYPAIESQVKFLQGKVLTVIDASISEPRQLKAVKDLVNKMFSEQLSWILQLCAPETRITTREALEAQGVDVSAIERGAVVES